MSKRYVVYMHVFPDGKKYIGKTCNPLKWRWNGGLGYKDQALVFTAILKYDWNNIKHYVLLEDLDADTAALAEAHLIQKWRTFRIKNKGRGGRYLGSGYNSVIPKVEFPEDWTLPKINKRKIIDIYAEATVDRYDKWLSGDAKQKGGNKPRKVRLVETGEIYASAREGGSVALTYDSNVWNAIRTGGTSGVYCACGKRDDSGHFDLDTGTIEYFAYGEVPRNYEVLWEGKAHWEYV